MLFQNCSLALLISNLIVYKHYFYSFSQIPFSGCTCTMLKAITLALFHTVTILLWLHHQDKIIDGNIMVSYVASKHDLLSSPNALFIIALFYIISIGTSLFAFISSFTRNKEFIMSLMILFSIFIAITSNILYSNYINNNSHAINNNNNLLNMDIKSFVVPFQTFAVSSVMFKQWTMYQNVINMNHLFINGQQQNIQTETIIQKYASGIVYVSYNIFINTFCFGLYGVECRMDKIGIFSLFAVVSVCFYTYYTLPQIKYDLYFESMKIKSIFIWINILIITEVLWVICLKYYLHEWYKQLLRILYMCFLICTMTIFPFCLECKKRIIFNHKIKIKPNHCEYWYDYVAINNDNFDKFSNFFAKRLDRYHLQNLLFVIDIMKYKSLLIEIIEFENAKHSLSLPFHYKDNLPSSPIVEQAVCYHNKQNGMNMEMIQSDLIKFCNKYIVENACLEVSFLSYGNRMELLDNLKTACDNTIDGHNQVIEELISILDKSVMEVNSMLQLLFIEFVINE